METSTSSWNASTEMDYGRLDPNETFDGNVTNDNDTDYEYTDSFSDYWEYDVAKFINEYYLYVVCGIGIPGNIACIVTLTFMRPVLSSAIYMVALAVADLVALALKITYLQLTAKDIRMGDTSCQFIFLVGTVSQMYANWVLVALTIERFVAIWFPFQVKKVCTTRNSVLVLVGMLLFFILANLQFIFTFEEVSDPFMVYDCRPKSKYSEFMQYFWYWIDGALYAIVPIILILVFNGLIIFAVRKSSKAQRGLTIRSRGGSEKANQQRQITTMLLTASLMFIVLILPNCIFFIAKEYWTWRETPYGIAQYYLVYQVIFLLSDLSHAVNFYLYCLSGRKFRRKFVYLICSCRNGGNVQRQPTTIHSRANGVHALPACVGVAGHSSATHISTITSSPAVTPTRCLRQD